eukprot:284265-Pyramimonas_sp.AAC.1
MSDSELVKFRKTCQSQRKPYHGGISASAKLVLLGDPAVHEALAPALQWCRMRWIANHCRPLPLTSASWFSGGTMRLRHQGYLRSGVKHEDHYNEQLCASKGQVGKS